MAARGLRVLGMACRELPEAPAPGVVPPPEALTFLGLQGMLEPLGADAWLRMGAVAAAILAAIELHKLLRRRPARSQA
jgi:hypothetical protein